MDLSNVFPFFRTSLKGGTITALSIVSFSSISSGLVIGSSNVPTEGHDLCWEFLKPYDNDSAPCFPLDDNLWHFILITSFCVSAFISSLFCGMIISRFGRKNTLLFNNIFFILGGLLTSLAAHPAMFCVGRLISGFGCGIAFVTVPIYIGEIAPAHSDGHYTTFHHASVAFGTLFSSLLSIYGSVAPVWRFTYGLVLVPSLIQSILIWSKGIETPPHLASIGKIYEAEESLKILKGDNNIHSEMSEIRRNLLFSQPQPPAPVSNTVNQASTSNLENTSNNRPEQRQDIERRLEERHLEGESNTALIPTPPVNASETGGGSNTTTEPSTSIIETATEGGSNTTTEPIPPVTGIDTDTAATRAPAEAQSQSSQGGQSIRSPSSSFITNQEVASTEAPAAQEGEPNEAHMQTETPNPSPPNDPTALNTPPQGPLPPIPSIQASQTQGSQTPTSPQQNLSPQAPTEGTSASLTSSPANNSSVSTDLEIGEQFVCLKMMSIGDIFMNYKTRSKVIKLLIFTLFQQLVGFSAIVFFYSTRLFDDITFGAGSSTVNAHCFNITYFFSILIGIFITNKIRSNKKQLLGSSAGVIMFSMMAFVGYITNTDILTLVSVYFYILAYTAGIAMTTNILITQGIPTCAIASIASVVTAFAWLLQVLVAQVFPLLFARIQGFVYLIFMAAAICIVIFTFIVFVIGKRNSEDNNSSTAST